jgi:hypothetical protein
MKLLRRETVCRQLDYDKYIAKQALRHGYHRTEFKPFNIPDLSKRLCWFEISGQMPTSRDMFFTAKELEDNDILDRLRQAANDNERLAREFIWLCRHHSKLYRSNYSKWYWSYEQDQVRIRANNKQPWDLMGVAVLERDY